MNKLMMTNKVNMMTSLSDPENEYEKQGVTFKIITDDMIPKVSRYLKVYS